jgi:hypothetical protein
VLFSGSMVIYFDVFDDFRYSRHDKRSKLPGWILSHLGDAHLNLSTDMALHIAREVCIRCFHYLSLVLIIVKTHICPKVVYHFNFFYHFLKQHF